MPSKIRRWFDSLVCRQRQFVCEIARLLNKRTKKNKNSHTQTHKSGHTALCTHYNAPIGLDDQTRPMHKHLTKRRRRKTHHYQAEAATSTKRIGMRLVVVEISAVERGIPIVSNIVHPANFTNTFEPTLLETTHNRRDRLMYLWQHTVEASQSRNQLQDTSRTARWIFLTNSVYFISLLEQNVSNLEKFSVRTRRFFFRYVFVFLIMIFQLLITVACFRAR